MKRILKLILALTPIAGFCLYLDEGEDFGADLPKWMNNDLTFCTYQFISTVIVLIYFFTKITL